MTDRLACWKCGNAMVDIPLPLVRQAECPACRADLYVWRMCEYYDARLARHCREPVADDVSDKERANFCGYFQARSGAYRPRDEAAMQARRQLDAVFGDNV